MSWEQLDSILEANRSDAAAEDRRGPEACPNDGSQLDVHPDGRRHCPAGDYIWDG